MTLGDRRKVFRLEVEAAREHVATIRLFVATVARVLRLEEELIADIKLAASEAATAVVRAGRSDVIVVELEPVDGAQVLTISPLTAEMIDGEVPRPADIITGLFPGAEVDERRRVLRIPVDTGSAR